MAVLLMFNLLLANAANVTWTGSGPNPNWTTAANWSPGAPQPSDVLFFDGSLQLDLNNNYAVDTGFGGLVFKSNAGAFTLGGNEISLSGTVENDSANLQTIALPTVLTAATTFNTVSNASSGVSGDILVTGAVSGTNSLLKAGGGTLTLGSKSYSGGTTVNGGTLVVSNDNGAYTMSGGSLMLNFRSYAASVQIAFTADSSVGVDLLDDIEPRGVDTYNTLGTAGYKFTKIGAGILRLGSGINASEIDVVAGTLASLGGSAMPQTHWGTNHITVDNGAMLRADDGGICPNSILLNGGDGTSMGSYTHEGVLVSGSRNNAANPTNNIFTGPITLAADSTIGSYYGNMIISGNITGPGALTKIGGNPLILGGTNTYGGSTTINAGKVQLASSYALPGGPTNGDVTLNNASILDLGGFNATINGLADDGLGGSAIDNTGTNASTLAFGGKDAPIYFMGALRSSGGNLLNLVKLGASSATFAGPNSTSGGIVVQGGKLELSMPPGAAVGGAISLADGTELSLHKLSAGAACKAPALTLGTSGATTLALDLGGFGSPSIAPFTVTNGAGTLSVGGTVTVNISGNPNLMSAGQFPLIKYSVRAGNGSFVLGTMPANIVATLVTNASGKSIDLKITSAPVTTWVGNLNDNWDITSKNWTVLGVASLYMDGVGVLFQDGAATNYVNLTTTVSPGGVLVNATTNYTFDGPGGIWAGDLTKNGSGTLTLLTANGYNNTTVSGGTLRVDNGGTMGSLGGGNVQDDATIIFNRADAVVINNNITGVGNVVQQSTNTLTLAGASTYAGGTVVNRGVVQLGQGMNQAAGSMALGAPAGSTPLVTVASGAALDMNDTRIGGLNNPVIISGSGTGANPNVGVLYTSGSGYQWFGSGTAPTVTNVQLAADAVIGGTNGWFQIGSQGGTVGGIDGKGHVLTKVGSSTIVLKQNALSALSTAVVANGRYVLTTSNPFGSSALVILSNNAAMDTWGEGNSGWNGITLPNSLVIGPGGGQMRNSQGAWYGHANYDTYNGAITLNDTLTLLNTSTYMGNPNPTVMTHGTMVFNGVFSGPGGLSCNASNGFGGNVITLNGVNTYTGPTTVAGGGGTLAITTGQRGGGAYTVLDGSVLDVGPATGFTSVPMSSLTLGNSSGAVLSLARLTSLSTLNAPIMITNFTAFGVTTILVPGFAFTAPGQYPLIKYTNTLASGGSFLAGGAVRGLPGYISNNVANSSIDLVVPGDSPVLWVGNAGNTWDIGSTANRLYHSASTTYQQTGSVGDAVAFDDTGLLTTVNLAAPVSPALVVVTNSTKAYTFTNSNIIGTTALLKEGPGMLTLSNGANTFIGGTLISGGTVRLGSDGAVNNSSGVVTITPGGTLDLNNYNPSGITINASGAGVGGNGAIVDNYSPSAGNTRGPGTINMMGDLTVGGTNRWSMRNGAHILNCPTNGYSLIKVGPGILDFSAATVSTNLGDLIILGGTFSHRNANAGGMGSLAYKVRVGAGATLDYNTTPPPNLKTVVCSNTATIQTDSAGIIVANPIILDGGTVYFDANYNNTATYTNVISGAGGIRFNYNSQITFTAPNTYTGNTEVRTGPGAGPAAYLKLSGVGSIASSANIILDGGGLTNYAGGAILDASARTDGTLTLVSGQTLRGDTGSSVKGNVVAVSGSTIWPGGPGYIQTMAFSNSLTFQAGSICAMDVNKDVTNLDTISVTGTLTYGGSLQINRLGTNAFAAGDSFKLFNAATYAGSFASVTPAPGAGLAWDTSALATSGTLKVVSGANTTPPNITTSLSGGSLTLAWPADRLGWRLLVQTNNLAHGISLNPLDWGVVAGSANTTNVVIVPDLSKPATFYRLVYP